MLVPFSFLSGWHPARLPGCIGFWSPADSLTTYGPDSRASIGEPVIYARDRSPAGNDLIQLDGNRQPELAYFNGIDASAGYAWDFNGSNTVLESINPSGLSGNFDASIYAVVRHKAVAPTGVLGGPFNISGMAANNTVRTLALQPVNNEWMIQHNGGNFLSGTAPTTAPTLMVYQKQAGPINTAEFEIYGAPRSPASGSSAANPNINPDHKIRIGGSMSSAGDLVNFLNGLVGMVLLYNRSLTALERAEVTEWISERYGL